MLYPRHQHILKQATAEFLRKWQLLKLTQSLNFTVHHIFESILIQYIKQSSLEEPSGNNEGNASFQEITRDEYTYLHTH